MPKLSLKITGPLFSVGTALKSRQTMTNVTNLVLSGGSATGAQVALSDLLTDSSLLAAYIAGRGGV